MFKSRLTEALVCVPLALLAGGAATADTMDSNIALVKQVRYAPEGELAQALSAAQARCVKDLDAAKKARGEGGYVPAKGELLSPAAIQKLLDQARVEEYFAGSRYAKYEHTPEIASARWLTDGWEGGQVSCAFDLGITTTVNIETPEEQLTTSYVQPEKPGSPAGIVHKVRLSPAIAQSQRGRKPLAPNTGAVVPVPGTTFQCALDNVTQQFCYLQGMTVHPGTGKKVLVFSRPQTALVDKKNPYLKMAGGASADLSQTYLETRSLEVGKPVDAKRFSLPPLAKAFRVESVDLGKED